MTSYAPPLTVEEKRWQAESDARTLANAKVITNDPARLQAATNAAQQMADEQSKEAKAMRNVSNMGPNSLRAGSKKTNPSTTMDKPGVSNTGAKKPRSGKGYKVFEKLP